MSNMAEPNWLAVASVFFIMIGLGIVLRAILSSSSGGTGAGKGLWAVGHRTTNFGLGVPVLRAGFLPNAMSHLGSAPLTPFKIGVMPAEAAYAPALRRELAVNQK